MMTWMTLRRNLPDSSGLALLYSQSSLGVFFSRWANKTFIISWSILTTRRPLASATLKRAMLRVCAGSIQNKTRSLWPSAAMTASRRSTRLSPGFDSSVGPSLPQSAGTICSAGKCGADFTQLVSPKKHWFGEQAECLWKWVTANSEGCRVGRWNPPPPPHHQINTSHSASHLSPQHPPPQSSTLETPSWIEMRRAEKNVAGWRGQSNHSQGVSQIIRVCTDLLFYSQETHISGKYAAPFNINDILGRCSSLQMNGIFPLHNLIRSVTLVYIHPEHLWWSLSNQRWTWANANETSTCRTLSLFPWSVNHTCTFVVWDGRLDKRKRRRPFETLTRVIARRLHITLI